MSARTQGVLVELSWILIALIELAPLEENMNPLVFGAQPFKHVRVSCIVMKDVRTVKIQSAIVW